MEHVAQVVEQAQGDCLRLLVDVRNIGEEVNVLEVLVTIRMIEKRTPNRPPLRVAIIEHDRPTVKTIRVVHMLIAQPQDRFHVFLDHEADAALPWLLEG